MRVTVLYFAQLADLAEKQSEELTIGYSSPEQLFKELKETYGFANEFRQIQVAINDRLSSHDISLKEGDRIAFLPPMSGG
ncbi:MAG: MoaD/ThiS family protein [Verrucomicrobiota bacterium]